jgi:hypothetical protein
MAREYRPFTVRGDGLDDKEATQYEFAVLGMLHSFDAIPTTRALMNGFRMARRDILVVPYDESDGLCNAASRSDWGLFPNKVYYSPDTWYDNGFCVSKGDAGDTPHEVLCHELVHALRRAAGVWNHGTKHGQEETLAIMITNIFASETNKKALRRNHHGHHPQKDPVLNTSDGYLAHHKHLVDRFVTQHYGVATELSCVNTHFNPIRAYFHGRCMPAWAATAYRPGGNPFR